MSRKEQVRELLNSNPQKYIVKFRELCDMTQQQLAASIPVSQSTLSTHENGQFNPSRLVLEKYVELFAKKLPKNIDIGSDIE